MYDFAHERNFGHERGSILRRNSQAEAPVIRSQFVIRPANIATDYLEKDFEKRAQSIVSKSLLKAEVRFKAEIVSPEEWESFSIYYFAKEGTDCKFSSVYPGLPAPTKIPFQKGVAQKFVQPSGSGVDLGFFDVNDLSKPLDGEIFPFVIYAEAGPPPTTDGVQMEESRRSAQAQITLAVIEKNSSSEPFQVKVVKQILWAEGERYELQVIFGLMNSAEAEVSGADMDDDMGKECVICLSEPRNTAVFPCRHM